MIGENQFLVSLPQANSNLQILKLTELYSLRTDFTVNG